MWHPGVLGPRSHPKQRPRPGSGLVGPGHPRLWNVGWVSATPCPFPTPGGALLHESHTEGGSRLLFSDQDFKFLVFSTGNMWASAASDGSEKYLQEWFPPAVLVQTHKIPRRRTLYTARHRTGINIRHPKFRQFKKKERKKDRDQSENDAITHNNPTGERVWQQSADLGGFMYLCIFNQWHHHYCHGGKCWSPRACRMLRSCDRLICKRAKVIVVGEQWRQAPLESARVSLWRPSFVFAIMIISDDNHPPPTSHLCKKGIFHVVFMCGDGLYSLVHASQLLVLVNILLIICCSYSNMHY